MPVAAVAATSKPASVRSRATLSRHIGWSSTTITGRLRAPRHRPAGQYRPRRCTSGVALGVADLDVLDDALHEHGPADRPGRSGPRRSPGPGGHAVQQRSPVGRRVQRPGRKAPPGAGATPAKASARSRCSQASSCHDRRAGPTARRRGQVGVRVDEPQHPRRLAGRRPAARRRSARRASSSARSSTATRRRRAAPAADVPGRARLGSVNGCSEWMLTPAERRAVPPPSDPRCCLQRRGDGQLPLGALAGRGDAARPCRPGRRIRPRIDSLTPSRPSAAACVQPTAGIPGPSSRTVTTTSVAELLDQHPGRRVRRRRAARTLSRQARTTASSSSTTCRAAAPVPPDRRPSRSGDPSSASDAIRSARPDRPGVAPAPRPPRRPAPAPAARPPARRPAGRARPPRRRARGPGAGPARAPGAPRRGPPGPAGRARRAPPRSARPRPAPRSPPRICVAV